MTFSDCVFVFLGIQREVSVRHIVICGLSVYTKCFPHFLINGKIFEKKIY